MEPGMDPPLARGPDPGAGRPVERLCRRRRVVRHADADADLHADSDSDADGDPHADAHPYADAPPHTDPYADHDADADAHADADLRLPRHHRVRRAGALPFRPWDGLPAGVHGLS